MSALLKALLKMGPAAGKFLGLGAKTVGREPFVKRPSWDYDPPTRRMPGTKKGTEVPGPNRPAWQTETSGRNPQGKFVPGGAKDAGWINRMAMNPTTRTGTAFRIGGLGLGGSIAADRISSLFSEEEVASDDLKAYQPQYGGSTPGWNPGSDVESRVQFQQNQANKYNRQMKKLLRNYGIVNLINRDSGKDMLKIGMAVLEQNIKSSGDDRQAKIFDAVFTPGNMPKTAKTAYNRVLQAGGTPEDAASISGAYVDMRPPAAASQKKEDVAVQVIASVQQLLAAGSDSQARSLLRQYIMSDHIGREDDSAGITKSIDVQVDEWMKMLGGGGTSPRNPGGITIDG